MKPIILISILNKYLNNLNYLDNRTPVAHPHTVTRIHTHACTNSHTHAHTHTHTHRGMHTNLRNQLHTHHILNYQACASLLLAYSWLISANFIKFIALKI